MSSCSNPTAAKVLTVLIIQFIILCVFINIDTKFIMKVMSSVRQIQKPKTSASIEEVLNSRAAALRSYCTRHRHDIITGYPDYNLSPGLLSWVWMSSAKHKLFYCATPKCGSTTWKSYLMEDLDIDWKVDTHVAAQQLGVLESYKKSSLDLIEFLEQFRPENRLIIVRNPWARLASAYDDKIIVKKWKLKRMCAGWKQYKSVQVPTFQQFIDCVLQTPPNVFYEGHTHPLTSLCAICHMDYNIILQLEEIGTAEPYLMKRLKFKVKPKYRPPRKLKNNTYQSRYANISQSQIRQLQNVYRYDIALFNYPKSPFD